MAEVRLNRLQQLERPETSLVPEPELEANRLPLKDRIIARWWNLEGIAWITLLILAIITRTIDLGPRALHQDEATHATFALDLYRGRSIFQYDPTWHGPFMYYVVSLSYFIFGGPTDTNARIPPVVFGIGIVALCWFLRPIVGKFGAFFAGLLVLISPSILYYSRNLRHDAYAVFGQLLMVIGLFRFLQNKPGHKIWWFALSGLGLSITYASHELVFMNTAILVVWLVMAFALEIIALPAHIRNKVGLKPKPTLEQPPEIPFELSDTANQTETNEPEQTGTETSTPVVSRSSLQKIMGKASLVGAVLFVIFTGVWLWGSTSLFRNTAETGDVPKLFNLPSWLILIPLGLVLALVAGSLLGRAIAAAWRGLEKIPAIVAAGTTLIAFAGVGGLLVYRLKNPRTSSSAAATITATTPLDAVPDPDISLLGLRIPVIAVNLVAALLVALVIGLLVGWAWQRRFFVFTRRGISGALIGFVLVQAIASLVSLRFMRFALSPAELGKYPTGLPKGNLFMVGPEVDKWLAYVVNGFFVALAVAIVSGWLVSLAEVLPDEQLRGSAALRGVLRIFRQPLALVGFFVAFGILYILLFGNFFFYAQGLADGIYRGIEYWAAVHDTRRIDQPWFYYTLLMWLYEPLPSLLTVFASVLFPVALIWRTLRKGRMVFTVRGLMAGYCVWWSIMAMVAYSVAGEKVPWLNMQVALPSILLASFVADNALKKVNWRQLYRPTPGLLFAGLFSLMFMVVTIFFFTLFTNPAPSNRWVQLAMAGLVALAIFLAIWRFWRSGRWTARFMRASILMVVSLVLLAYGAKATLMLNYNNGDINVEPMIQVQSTPELLLFIERLGKLSRDYRQTQQMAPAVAGQIQTDPTKGLNLPVLLAQSVAPPLTWYLRDFTDINYFTPNNDASQNTEAAPSKDAQGNQYAIIAVDRGEDQNKLQEQVKDNYTRMLFRRYWWFPEDDSGYLYVQKVPSDSKIDRKNILSTDWKRMWEAFTAQPGADRMWRYMLYRDMPQQLQSYDMVVYVRNDLMADFGVLGGINTQSTTTGAFKLFDTNQPGNKDGQLKTPRTLAFTPSGDIAVLDSGNARVEIYGPDGTFKTKWGKSGTGDGQFNLITNDGGPGGIATDKDGNIYVADTWNYRIQKFDSTGKLITKWGQGFDTQGNPETARVNPTGFYGPRGLFFDTVKNELYVADTGNRRVVVFDPNGNYIRQFGSKGAQPGQFDEPTGIAVSADGKVYVTDARNKRIQILDRDGNYISEIKVTDWREQYLNEPYVVLDSVGNVYASDGANGRIYKFGPDGNLIQTYESGPTLVLVNPVGMAIGPDGLLYVADAKQNSVVKIKI